jgi:hypothetical protein
MDYLLNHKFELTGLEEDFVQKPKRSGMFSAAEMGMLPRSDKERYNDLNLRIYNIIEHRSKVGISLFLSQQCNLNPETVRKYIRIGSPKTLPKEMLAKFVVACALSVDEANELFELHSHALQPEKILLDAVIVHCLEGKHDLDEFFATCAQVGLNIEYKV